MKNLMAMFIGLVAVSLVTSATAATIQCGGPDRYAELDSAESCMIGLKNPKASTIAGYFGTEPEWEDAGELVANGTDKFFKVEVTSGSWGSQPVAGTWTISSDFWSQFESAVISMHVGNGGGDPDHFAWLITPGETDGTWSYWISQVALNDNGGGLSNVRLWGQRSDVQVPEPASLALLGLGIAGLIASRRRQS